jgi:hypothetical protein
VPAFFSPSDTRTVAWLMSGFAGPAGMSAARSNLDVTVVFRTAT